MIQCGKPGCKVEPTEKYAATGFCHEHQDSGFRGISNSQRPTTATGLLINDLETDPEGSISNATPEYLGLVLEQYVNKNTNAGLGFFMQQHPRHTKRLVAKIFKSPNDIDILYDDHTGGVDRTVESAFIQHADERVLLAWAESSEADVEQVVEELEFRSNDTVVSFFSNEEHGEHATSELIDRVLDGYSIHDGGKVDYGMRFVRCTWDKMDEEQRDQVVTDATNKYRGSSTTCDLALGLLDEMDAELTEDQKMGLTEFIILNGSEAERKTLLASRRR